MSCMKARLGVDENHSLYVQFLYKNRRKQSAPEPHFSTSRGCLAALGASAIDSCMRALAAAALLRSRRHCITGAAPTSVPPDPPAISAHVLLWKVGVTR